MRWMVRVKLSSGARTDEPALAPRIGERLKRARLAAGMTQQQLAGDRYTKAYVSALENGLAKPSIKALDYLAAQLGTTASQLMADDQPRWTRLEADLRLASGDWQSAVDAYSALLEAKPDLALRAEVLLGRAEALARLDRGALAAADASQAAELFDSLGRPSDAALAGYWLSAAEYYQDNVAEAKAILHGILAKVRAGLRMQPDFKLRLLMALSSNEAREGNHDSALAYLEEVRGLADELDDRRRAAFLFDLAHSYSETGDYEAALRSGYASLALFTAAETPIEVAKLENELAIAHLRTGNTKRARELAARAHGTFARLGDERLLAHVLDTEAQIRLKAGDADGALKLAAEALELAKRTNNPIAALGALTSSAQAHAALGDAVEARRSFERAVETARNLRRLGMLRQALTDLADFLAAGGDHEAAFRVSREALGVGVAR